MKFIIQQYRAFYFLLKLHINTTKPATERVQALADIRNRRYTHLECIRLKLTYAYVVIATNPVHQLQIRPILHNQKAPLPFPKLHPGLCSSVGMRRGTDWQTDTHTAVTNIHFTWAKPHAKRNKNSSIGSKLQDKDTCVAAAEQKHVTNISSATITAQLHVITILTHISHQYRPQLDTICLPNNKQYQKINRDKQTN